MKVLFVDDEMIVRVALKSMVDWEETEFQIVDAVSDGVAALAAVDKYRPELIVTDLKMPNLDGLGLVQALTARGYPGKIVVLSNYGEFEMAREAMRLGVTDYLLKATIKPEELLATLRRAAALLPQEALAASVPENDGADWIDSAALARAISNNVLSGLSHEPLRRYYIGFYIFTARRLTAGQEESSEGRELLANLVGETIGHKETALVLPLTAEDCLALYPLRGEEELRADMEQDARKISGAVQAYMNTRVGFVLLEPISDQFALVRQTRAAMHASGLTLYRQFQGFLRSKELDAYLNDVPAEGTVTLETVCRELSASAFSQAQDTLRQTLEALPVWRVSPTAARAFLVRLLDCLCFELSLGAETPDETTWRTRATECVTLADYGALFQEMVQTLARRAETGSPADYRREVGEMMRYMQQNIDKKISLSDVAAQVRMNESYVSRLFKNETGWNITAYIHRLKMQKAQQLLRDPDVFVKEVATQLGYDEQSYFNRMFNKYFGVSPIDFRRNYQNCINQSKKSINEEGNEF